MAENLENRDVGGSRKRLKWEKSVNKLVFECYLRSDPKKRGFRKRLKQIWDEIGVFEATEQRLADQARAIKSNNWLSDLEIEDIARKIENNDVIDKNTNNLQIEEATQEDVDPVPINTTTTIRDDALLDNNEAIENILQRAETNGCTPEQLEYHPLPFSFWL